MQVGDLVKFTEDPIALVTGEADSVGFLMVNNEDREVFVGDGALGLLVERPENQHFLWAENGAWWHVCFSDVGSVWMTEDYLEVINESR